jgi:hypothetical protein
MKKRRRGSILSGVSLFLIGLVFLLDNLGYIDASLIWPIILVGLGIAMLINNYLKK